MKKLLCCLLLAAFSLPACKPSKESGSSAFGLKTTELKVADHPLEVEIADTAETMSIGLMYRQTMAEERGMIFVFPELRKASFWMHNTALPLDIAYLDRGGKIREIHDAKPYDDRPIPSQSADIAYALETNAGWFARHGVKLEMKVQDLPPFPSR